MLTNPVFVNGLIVAVLTLATFLLRRKFSNKDTVTTIMVAEMRRLRAEQNWQRRVINILDQETYEYRRAMEAAGIPLPPRAEWPARPEETLPDLASARAPEA